nr:S-layer family protein [Petrachloros mirabilis]
MSIPRDILSHLCLLLGAGGALAPAGFAQVVSDNTVSTQVSRNGLNFVVDGGTIAGRNQFHSFSAFSIPTQGSVLFNNPAVVNRIISRVTGNSLSAIDGVLATANPSDFFLINPNGIIFGPNATLNIGGSFIGSTAEAVQFADGTVFSAREPQAQPLLTVSTPIGLQFGANAGSIVYRSQIELAPEKTMALVGQGVRLENSKIATPGGRVELGSVQGPGQVGLKPAPGGWVLSYSEMPAFSDLTLIGADIFTFEGANIFTPFASGGIQLQGKNINLLDNSRVASLNPSVISDQPGGSIQLSATDTILLDRSIIISGTFSPFETGRAGDIDIQSRRLVVRDGSSIDALTQGIFEPSARGGDITIDASESVEVLGEGRITRIASEAFTSDGGAGNITIRTGRLRLEGGGQIATSTRIGSSGDGGQISVTATESIRIRDRIIDPLILANFDLESAITPSGILSESRDPGTTGSGGIIRLNTPYLLVENKGVISARTRDGSIGQPGSIFINADRAEIRGSESLISADFDLSSLTSTPPNLPTQGGNITFTGGELRVRNGAALSVSGQGQGTAGDLRVNARQITLDNRAKLLAESDSGDGGNIYLRAEDLILLRRGSLISTSVRPESMGGGSGGNIDIKTQILLAFPTENSDIRTDAFTGDGGRVTITARNVFGIQFREQPTPLSDITASSTFGLAGTVEINTPEVDPSVDLIDVPEVEAVPVIAQGCNAATQSATSSFVNVGRGGISPRAVQSGLLPWQDLRLFSTRAATVPSTEAQTIARAPDLIEAQGWVRQADGAVMLTATALGTVDIDPASTPCQGQEL